MKVSLIYLARFCSLSWRFLRWVELEIFACLLYGLGLLFEKVSVFAGPRFPEFTRTWAWFWRIGQKLVAFSSELVIVVLICYFIVWLIAKICGVKMIRSNRLSGNLRQMISTAVDEIPNSDKIRRNKAKNVVSEQANRAVRKSFVFVRKNDALAIVNVPRRIEARKVINNYLDDVANDLSDTLGMTSSSWQTVRNSFTFASYEVMQFKS